jgi:hypothetical protein
MPIDLDKFKIAYEKWVEESLPDYRAGKMQEIVKKYPFVVSDDIPWTPYQGRPSEQTFALVTSGGLYLKKASRLSTSNRFTVIRLSGKSPKPSARKTSVSRMPITITAWRSRTSTSFFPSSAWSNWKRRALSAGCRIRFTVSAMSTTW